MRDRRHDNYFRVTKLLLFHLFCVNGGAQGVAEQKQVGVALLLIGGEDTMISGGRDADQPFQILVIFLNDQKK